jgi:RNA polymerase sigma-70 factor (ECF subfamily)
LKPADDIDGRRTWVSGGDLGLISGASRGDVEAFSKLVEAHSTLVYQKALRMLGSERAQDASQEVWVKVWANIKGFKGESAFATWLYRITVNTCLSLQRREARRQKSEVEWETSYLSESPGGDADPEAAVLNSERRQEVRVALGQVRAEHRVALVLRHMEGLSYSEIAEVLDVPDGTAKGWVSRGRAAMLGTLAREGLPAVMPVQTETAPGKRAERLPGLSPSA